MLESTGIRNMFTLTVRGQRRQNLTFKVDHRAVRVNDHTVQPRNHIEIIIIVVFIQMHP